ncbi:ECF transporter S component [Alloiococcus sp. CFN-8]|uniref:ECF transporter S component n=1 Tax=Alloiococcus sp. CFN-8 TaxID=3416081 RepID=UPI003CEDFCAD
MENKLVKVSVNQMVRLAILIGIILLMSYTPLGYLKVGAVEITFIMIPVVVGAVVMGPKAGAFLGGVFGFTSFLQCFGFSAFGTMLFGINPVFTFILCMVPRILMGWLSGVIFKKLHDVDKTNVASYVIACISGAILNTVLFVGFLLALFGNTEYIQSFGSNLWLIIVAIVGVNGLIEAGVCAVVGSAISKALALLVDKK